MDMISVVNDCSVKCYCNVKSKEGPNLFQKLIAKSTTNLLNFVAEVSLNKTAFKKALIYR